MISAIDVERFAGDGSRGIRKGGHCQLLPVTSVASVDYDEMLPVDANQQPAIGHDTVLDVGVMTGNRDDPDWIRVLQGPMTRLV
jgi:hypothetical protein